MPKKKKKKKRKENINMALQALPAPQIAVALFPACEMKIVIILAFWG